MQVASQGNDFYYSELARLDARELLRLRGLRLEGDLDSIPYGGNPAVRGPLQLPIRFEPGLPGEASISN